MRNHSTRLDRLQRRQRKTNTEPVKFLLVQYGEPIAPGTKVIRLTWGDGDNEPQDAPSTLGTNLKGTW